MPPLCTSTCSGGCGRPCECYGQKWCNNTRPFCGRQDCNRAFELKEFSKNTTRPSTSTFSTTARANTFVAAAPPRPFPVNTLPICNVPGCGRPCFNGEAICSSESCKVASNLLRNRLTIEVTNGVCWSCKNNLGHSGCTDQRHKRMFKNLRDSGCIRIVNPSPVHFFTPQAVYNNNSICSGHYIQMPAPGFSGPISATPGFGPTSSAMGFSSARVRINGVGDMMIARNPLVAPVRETRNIVMYDPHEAMAFAFARGQDPARVHLRMQQQGSYSF